MCITPRNSLRLACLTACLCFSGAGQATEQVYTPNNPSFGGNPLNGAVLLNSANAQNRFKAPSSSSSSQASSALESFNIRLQAMVLDRLATSLTGGLFDSAGNLIPGTINTSNFTINIVDIGNGMLRITTTDRVTGASTSFEVSRAP